MCQIAWYNAARIQQGEALNHQLDLDWEKGGSDTPHCQYQRQTSIVTYDHHHQHCLH
jgi:hypothetical protein